MDGENHGEQAPQIIIADTTEEQVSSQNEDSNENSEDRSSVEINQKVIDPVNETDQIADNVELKDNDVEQVTEDILEEPKIEVKVENANEEGNKDVSQNEVENNLDQHGAESTDKAEVHGQDETKTNSDTEIKRFSVGFNLPSSDNKVSVSENKKNSAINFEQNQAQANLPGLRKRGTIKKMSLTQKTLGGDESESNKGPEPQEAATFFESYFSLPTKPRLMTSFSLSAQFSLFKGYENKMREILVNKFPEYNSLINRTKTPKHSSVVIKNGTPATSLQKSFNPDMFEDRKKNKQEDKKNKRTADQNKNARRFSNVTLRSNDEEDLPASKILPFMSERRQLLMSRKLEIAHYLLDEMQGKQKITPTSETCDTDEMKNKRVNTVEGYNWWTNDWSSQFKVSPI